ncbi:MAG: HAMP domain-containing sensor histidine kinase [Campylobacterota bacterium]|nr:HAMP domain-containing sensor histidine kinase [Campylobacterota bacterium]
MISSEQKAVNKFFFIYFFSMALLISSAAVFYYYQQKHLRLHHELFSMIQYAKTVKHSGFTYEEEGLDYTRIEKPDGKQQVENIKRVADLFHLTIPSRRSNRALLITKDAGSYDRIIQQLFYQIITTTLILLTLFSIISYYLSLLSIRPLKKTIQLLDAFIKDLVHDLNTPTTSILLNIKMLKNKSSERDPQRLDRIEEATNEIASLYKNLAILLDESKLICTTQDICPIVRQSVHSYRELYPDLNISLQCEKLETAVHPEAFSQMIGNIISNACKYNRPGGYVTVRRDGKRLIIEDGGIGMKTPEKVFERYYTESLDGHGIGMHIVSRLAKVMNIGIVFHSEEKRGTRCILTLR